MALSDRIQEHVQRLPPSLQAEVLDFVEYLAVKAEREAVQQERRDWSSLSLSSAMRDMEDEDAPVYTPLDVRADSIEDHPESTEFPRWPKEMPYIDGSSRAI